MTYGVDFTHEIPCPVRIGPKATGEIVPSAQWQSIWSASGWWSNVDVYLEVGADWSGARLRLWSLTAGLRSLIVTTTVSTSGMKQIGGVTTEWRGIGLGGRGHPGSSWLVEVQSPNATPLSDGIISGEVWGTESSPEGVGNTPGHTIADMRMGSRASHLMGWPLGAVDPLADPVPIGPAFDGPWLPILVTNSGELVISSVPPVVFTNFSTLVQSLIGLGPQAITSLTCNNTNAADRFIQLHDSLFPVLLGAVPLLSFRVPAATTIGIGTDFFTTAGVRLFTPRWAFSTTSGTFTAGAAADQTTQITYRAAL